LGNPIESPPPESNHVPNKEAPMNTITQTKKTKAANESQKEKDLVF